MPQVLILYDVMIHFSAPFLHEAPLSRLNHLSLNLFLSLHSEVDQQYYDYDYHQDAPATDIYPGQIGITLNYLYRVRSKNMSKTQL